MKKQFLFNSLYLSILLLSFNTSLDAQPIIEWKQTYGGSLNEQPLSIQQTVDGGYIMAGNALSNDGDVGGNNGAKDFWIVKTDSGGALEWEKNFGGSDNDEAFSIQQTNEGGYIIAGASHSTDGDVGGNYGDTDCWILKLDVNGELEWEQNFGGSAYERATSIQQTMDGGYIVTAISESNDGNVGGNYGEYDYWVFKINPTGALEWENNYGGSDSDFPTSIQLTEDGGYILTGPSRSIDMDASGNNGNYDFWIIKLDTTGILEWEQNFGGSNPDTPWDIQQTNDGGFIITGNTLSNDGDVGGNNGVHDIWLLKINNTGTLEWEQNFGGSNSDIGSSVLQTTDGGYICAGGSSSIDGDVGGNNGGDDYWVIKLNTNGELEWEQNFGGSGSEWVTDIQQTTDGGLIVAGYTQSNNGDVDENNGSIDFWIIKLSSCVATQNAIDLTICENDPPVILNGQSFDQTGIYLIDGMTTAQGCDSSILLNLTLADTSSLGSANAGLDAIICNSEVTLYANQLANTSGNWTSLDGGNILNPNQAVTNTNNLQLGNNVFVWTLSHDLCGFLDSDTINIFVENTPDAIDDFFDNTEDNPTVLSFNILDNDNFSNLENYYYQFLGNAAGNLLDLDEGNIQYTASESMLGSTLTFDYILCNQNCMAGCDTAQVSINLIKPPAPVFPNTITPNGDGINDFFIIPDLEENSNQFTNRDLSIFNRWGDIVFHSKPYQNNWNGTDQDGQDLPQGTYYYFLRIDIGEGIYYQGDVTILK